MELLTTAQVARRLDVTTTTVRNLVLAGKISAHGKLPTSTGSYLFEAAEVARYVATLEKAS